MGAQFEAAGDMADWPKNVPGKPTQAAVFGMYHETRGKVFEVLWTGKFPDLQPALYWAAKKEMEAVHKGKWVMACRVAWQHDLTPEQALEVARRDMEPQMDRAMRSYAAGDDADLGAGPMRPVRPGEADRYVEIVSTDNAEDDPLAAFFLPKDPRPTPGLPDGWRKRLGL
jgi:hypothetical protein